MIENYTELLPSYLNGDNIRKHSEIIHEQDMKLYEKIQLLKGWNNLNRPILVERVQNEPGIADFYIHINVPSPIKSVKTQGAGGIDEEFDEDELITEKTIQLTLTDNIIPVMPKFKITVETWDGVVYTKGYMENDEKKGDEYDHDEFIDLIGKLLGIPRRIYADQNYGQEVSNYKNVYPPFFTKSMYGTAGKPITEDDYCYIQRLKKFITEYNQKPLPVLMAELLYEWKSTEYVNMGTRNSSLTDELLEHVGEPIINICNNNPKYINIDYTDITEIINQYAEITRPCILTEQSLVAVLPTSVECVDGTLTIVGEVYGYSQDYEDEYVMYHCPIDVFITENGNTENYVIYSNSEDNLINTSISGLNVRDAEVTIQYHQEYGNIVENTEHIPIHNKFSSRFTVETVSATDIYSSVIATLFDSNNNPITNATVKIKEGNNILHTSTTDASGKAFTDMGLGLNVGSHNLSLVFEGNDDYEPSIKNFTMEIVQGVNPNDNLLLVSAWKRYSNRRPTADLTPVNENAVVTGDIIKFTSSYAHLYSHTLLDFINNDNHECHFLVRKTGGNGRFEIGFMNNTIGKAIGYAFPSSELRYVNEEEGINLPSSPYGEVLYGYWNEVIFKKVGENLVIYHAWDGNRAFIIKEVPLGDINMEQYYFFVRVPVGSSYLELTTDWTVEYYPARDE